MTGTKSSPALYLPLIVRAGANQRSVKIPVKNISEVKAGSEYWLRVSFQTQTNSLWAPAGQEIAWQQMKLDVKTPPPRPSSSRMICRW